MPSRPVPSVESIRADLAADKVKPWQNAQRVLQTSADATFLPFIHEVLNSPTPNPVTLFSAATALVRLEGMGGVKEALERTAETHRVFTEAGEPLPSLDAFLEQVWALMSEQPKRMSALILELLRHDQAALRAFAAFFYSGVETADVTPLLTALRDADPFVRQSAVSAASAFSDLAVVPALIPLLEDEDEQVRVITTYVLADLQDPQAVEALQRAGSSDSSKKVRTAANRAHGQLDRTRTWLRYLLIALAVGGVVGLLRLLL